jgi:hypothetical protein
MNTKPTISTEENEGWSIIPETSKATTWKQVVTRERDWNMYHLADWKRPYAIVQPSSKSMATCRLSKRTAQILVIEVEETARSRNRPERRIKAAYEV